MIEAGKVDGLPTNGRRERATWLRWVLSSIGAFFLLGIGLISWVRTEDKAQILDAMRRVEVKIDKMDDKLEDFSFIAAENRVRNDTQQREIDRLIGEIRSGPIEP